MSDVLSSLSDATECRFQVVIDVHLLLLDANDRVLLGRRQNTGYADGAYHVPSGHLEKDESVVAALIREAHEEVGVAIAPDAVEFAHVMHNSSSGGRVGFFFTVRRWEGNPVNREPEKCGDLRWFHFAELPEFMVEYCRTALSHIRAGKTFSTYDWHPELSSF